MSHAEAEPNWKRFLPDRDLHPAVRVLALLAVVVVCGFLPYAELLGHLPWGADGTKWITQASFDNRYWQDYVFRTRHFIGYRPMTCLLYTSPSPRDS